MKVEVSKERYDGILYVNVSGGNKDLEVTIWEESDQEIIPAEGRINNTNGIMVPGATTEVYKVAFRILGEIAEGKGRPVRYSFVTQINSPMALWILLGRGADLGWTNICESEDGVSAEKYINPK